MGSRDGKFVCLQSSPASQECCAQFRAQYLNRYRQKRKHVDGTIRLKSGLKSYRMKKTPKNHDAEFGKENFQVRLCSKSSNI